MRILGIDPNTKGVGFVILENDHKLIDWGIKYLPKQSKLTLQSKTSCKYSQRNHKDRNYLRIVEDLIAFYEPDTIVFEDWTTQDSRRSIRVKKLLHQISLLVVKLGLPANCYSRLQLQKHFAEYKTKTKYEIASFLSHLFPELLPLLPRKRKTWMSEDVRMNIFVALAFCLILVDR